MWKLKKQFRDVKEHREKNKKRELKQLIHGDERVEKIKEEREQQLEAHERKYADILQQIARERLTIQT